MTTTSHTTELATLGGGCFWCLEAVYDQLRGVDAVESGYAGGQVANPTYRQVCDGTTGHAEVVQLRFDPAQVSFRELLEVFFTIHDPTTPNRQGHDIGTQYRSAIFPQDEAQRAAAEAAIVKAGALWPDPVVTTIETGTWYPAEDYHQEYYARTGDTTPYCNFVVGPKVRKFREKYADRLKSRG